jgi:hypothetical protein
LGGRVERCTTVRVEGWAADGEQPIELEIRIGDESVGRVVANRPRPDVAATGIPAECGFAFSFPRPVKASEQVSVRFADGTQLPGSPRNPEQYDGHLDICTPSRVAGWAVDGTDAVKLHVFVADKHVAEIRCDRVRAGFVARGGINTV